MREAFQPHLDWIATQAEHLRPTLLRLSNINSGSFNVGGVRTVAEHVAALYEPLSPQIEWLTVAPYRASADDGSRRERPLGPALRLRMHADAPLQVFVGGHLDTVFGIEHPFQNARELDADTLAGPGVADLKGGLLVMWLALMALERSPWRGRIGWEVLLNPDEEIGSAGSAPLLREAAQRNHLGLIYEPALPDGSLASARKGSGNFELIVHGRAAHAGRNPEQGRNAIVATATLIEAVQALNGRRPGLTINPGYVRGGGPLNVVPDRCIFKFNVRTTQADDEAWLLDRLEQIRQSAPQDGFRYELRGGFSRPPKPISPPMQRLMDWISDCGRELGTDIRYQATGGCCDGNNLAAYGLANLDNLGVVGRDIHSDQETMRYSSLAERAQVSALLLMKMASRQLQWV
ncbi:MAG TPA: hydrolase [Solimonas sp.]